MFVGVPRDLLTTKQVADRLGVAVSTVSRMARDGRLIPALKTDGLRGAMWFEASDVDDILATAGDAS